MSQEIFSPSSSLDGLWHALYGSAVGGTGYLLLRKGKVLGCDNQYFIEGSYEVCADGTVKALIAVDHFSGEPRTIFGDFGFLKLMNYTAELTGKADPFGLIVLAGQVNGNPDLVISVRLARLLPGVGAA